MLDVPIRDASFAERALAKANLRTSLAHSYPESVRRPELRSNQFGDSQLAEFSERGIAAFGQYLDEDELADVFRYLARHPVFNAHIAGASDLIPRRIGDPEDPAEAYQFGAYAEHIIAGMPHVTKMALNPVVLNFVSAYFGVRPLLLDVHLWWSFPAPGKFGPFAYAGQGFHRDFRSLQDIQFFVCLTDLPGDEGAHEYFAGTHDERMFARQLQRHETLKNLPKEQALRLVFFPSDDGYGERPGEEAARSKWIEMLGASLVGIPMRAGHCFMIDTMGLHRGAPPKVSRRLMFSARFSASGAEPAPSDRTRPELAPQTGFDEHSYALSAFKAKLGEVLGVEWSADAGAPNDEGVQELETDAAVRLSNLERSLVERTRRLTSLEMALEGCTRRLLAAEKRIVLLEAFARRRPYWRRVISAIRRQLRS
jgi:hypothetical protein